MHPKSWWWTPEIDFMALIVHSLQMGNWQRGGGRGAKPKLIKKPAEKRPKPRGAAPEPASGDELTERKQRMRAEMERRRKAVS